MKIKKLAAALSALMLTSCAANTRGEYYETVPGAESVTVSLTEPEPEPAPDITEPDWLDVGLFLPVVNSGKKDAELEDKLRPYLKKILLGESLLHISYYVNYEAGIPYETEPEYPDKWARLDRDFVSDKAQLLNYFRTVYTDNYMDRVNLSDGGFDGLFGSESMFKEEDGGVWRRIPWGAKGVTGYCIDDFRVLSYDGAVAELGMRYIHDYGYGYEKIYLRHDDGCGWRLDRKGDNYYARFHAPEPMSLGSVPRPETASLESKLSSRSGIGPEFVFTYFNEILENECIEYNGKKYCQTKYYFPVQKMREAFADFICEYKWEWSDKAENFVRTDEPLLSVCTEKYIDGVFIEFNGILYRRADAPAYEVVYPDYESRSPVAAEISTPYRDGEPSDSGALGGSPYSDDNWFHVYICGEEKVIFTMREGGGRAKLASDIPLREISDGT